MQTYNMGSKQTYEPQARRHTSRQTDDQHTNRRPADKQATNRQTDDQQTNRRETDKQTTSRHLWEWYLCTGNDTCVLGIIPLCGQLYLCIESNTCGLAITPVCYSDTCVLIVPRLFLTAVPVSPQNTTSQQPLFSQRT